MLKLDYPVILASGSPRRRELLEKLVAEFDVVVADVDEDALTVEDPEQTARILAREKALTVYADHRDSIVIGGDTVVGF